METGANMSMTITEALAEVKTIGKRLAKKKEGVMQYLARDSRVKDPLEREGGSVEYIKKERQAISDLEKRVVNIRTAITKSNLETVLAINGTSMSVFEWLTWRREVSENSKSFVTGMRQGIIGLREKITKEGKKMVTSDADADITRGDAVVHIDEKALLDEAEKLEITLGDLDGKLSLLNATTLINV